MAHLSIVLAFLATSLVSISSGQRVVCYFTSWTVYRPDNGKFGAVNIDPSLCTHVVYAFVGLNADGSVWDMDDWEFNGLAEVQHLMDYKATYPDFKVLLSMGGWNEGEGSKYSSTIGDPDKRASIVSSVVSYMDQYGFDGFDLDWEYPNQRGGKPSDIDDILDFLRQLKAALGARGLLLSAAVPGGINSTDISYPDVQAISDTVDLLNVMTYDFHGAFEPFVGHVAPLYASPLDETEDEKELNVNSGVRHWLEKGADASKINLGVGTYGRSFTLADPSDTRLYAPAVGDGGAAQPYTRQDGIMGYNELCEFHSDWEYVWDDDQKVPHRISGNQWVGYEDTQSVTLKVQLAKELNLGGIMVWSLDTDDFLGICGDGPYPLLNAIKNTLHSK